jgi:hypothetical protein
MQKETLIAANELETSIEFLKAKIKYFYREIDFIEQNLNHRDVSINLSGQRGYYTVSVPITKETSDFLKNEIEIFEDMVASLEKTFESL